MATLMSEPKSSTGLADAGSGLGTCGRLLSCVSLDFLLCKMNNDDICLTGGGLEESLDARNKHPVNSRCSPFARPPPEQSQLLTAGMGQTQVLAWVPVTVLPLYISRPQGLIRSFTHLGFL